MKEEFFALSESLARELQAAEILLCNLAGERSDFVRFNHSKVRQAGSVEQRALSMRLVHAGRQASARIAIAGTGQDFDIAKAALARLRDAVLELPQDPWLLINEAPQSTASERRGTVAPAEEVVAQATRAAQGRDFVGFYAGGTIYRGFANSLGQRNWHEVDSFNFDWSLYLEEDKAVKTGYAGFHWEPKSLEARVEAAARQLEFLAIPARTLEPGEYRAYLTPRALEEMTGLLSWGGFSARSHATKQSPLLRMQEGETLSSKITVLENT